MCKGLLLAASMIGTAGHLHAQDLFISSFDAYASRSAFLSRVQPGYFENGFSDVFAGALPYLAYDSGGLSYVISATTGDLYNADGLVSTRYSSDAIQIDFTGSPVTAIGGNFWATDVDVVPTGTRVEIYLSDGSREVFVSKSPADFRGFVTASPIAQIVIDAPSDVAVWSTLDNLIVGTRQ